MKKQSGQVQDQVYQSRRRQILEAAIKTFSERGFHKTTIRDISQEAGIAVGTIYNYFKNKEDLLIGLLDMMNESSDRNQDFATGKDKPLSQFMESYMTHRFQLIGQNLDFFRAVLPEVITNRSLRETYLEQIISPTMEIATDFFRKKNDTGSIATGDIKLTTRIIAASVLGLLMLRLIGDKEVDARWEELPTILSNHLLQGLQPDTQPNREDATGGTTKQLNLLYDD